MSNLTNTERLNLDKMIKASDAEDNTEKIRELKHSKQIENDIQELLNLKSKYSRLSQSNPDQFDTMCEKKCEFIFTNYTQIYNKVKKDNINLNLLAHFLVILRKIENNEINQHEGSVMVGKVLKEMYVDSALREGKKTDLKNKKNTKVQKKPTDAYKNISYKDYKQIHS
uniref:Uncharacterized protein n=1 Tax=Nucleocytoviricota sp. TaxID=2809609 RepID=A0A9E8K1G1_9VIRU|nr:hypothetical protein [Nucleocytoviricota sp.]UZT29281.1 hypothetical protein [Nucleocytoviricota sp.]